MEESTGFEQGMGGFGLSIEGVLRRAARSLIQRAIESEAAILLEEYAEVRMVDGRRTVVRNGHLPEREILTALGPVPVRVPKVRDRSGSGIVFHSTLVLPYVRKSKTEQSLACMTQSLMRGEVDGHSLTVAEKGGIRLKRTSRFRSHGPYWPFSNKLWVW